MANYLCFEYVIETKGRATMGLEFGMFTPPSYAAPPSARPRLEAQIG